MKVGRNDPCPCGSGKKYKHCCYAKESVKHEPEEVADQEMQVETSETAEHAEADTGRKKDFGHDKGRGRFHGNSRGGTGSFSPRVFRGSQRGN